MFIVIGGRLLNTNEIKWAGYPQSQPGRVQVEFVSGGWCLLEEGTTLVHLAEALKVS